MAPKLWKEIQQLEYQLQDLESHLLRLWVQGILYIALPNDSKVLGHLDGCLPQELVLPVIQRLAWSHHYGLTSVDAQWVQVLHVTYLGREGPMDVIAKGRQERQEAVSQGLVASEGIDPGPEGHRPLKI